MTGYDKIEHASLTDVGIRRSHNQDAHATLLATDEDQWRGRGHVFMVADGMGAHAVGEMASDMAVSIVPHTYHKHTHQGPAPALRKAFVEANASIHNRGQQNREFEGMGTTSTALVIRPEGAWLGHVGDSRAYRIRDNRIEQLTFDHSLVWELARRQGVDPDSLRGIPSNVIVRSLGPEPLVQVDVEGPHPLKEGDIFLICSDGLSGQLTDSEMGAIASALPPAEASRFLVNMANMRGGPDNITVVIIRVGAIPGEVAPEETARKPLLKRLPWPFQCLLLGIGLASIAVVLLKIDFRMFGVVSMVAAALSIIAGLIGLYLQHQEDLRLEESEADISSKPRTYRQVSCPIEKPLVEKLARAEVNLKAQIETKSWEVDWKAYKEHHDLADKYLEQNNLPGAFREYCRAMSPLLETLHKQRGKGEEFRPFWDKQP